MKQRKFLDHRVAVIAATGGVPSVRAAKAATFEIPIVFTTGGNPVALPPIRHVRFDGRYWG
jgi:ABC-type uncharacterized transport system substrate-binding protein